MNKLSESLPKSLSNSIPQIRDEEVLTPIASDTIRNISIEPLDSGYIVRVGCQSIAVETKEKLLFNLTSYINDPAAYETLYYKNNKKLI